MTDLWWTGIIGTATGVFFSAALIGLLLYLRRIRDDARRERNALLSEGERRYSALFHSVSDIVYMHDLGGVILEVNKPAADLLGVSIKNIVGMSVRDVVHPRYRSAVDDYLRRFTDGSGGEARGLLRLWRTHAAGVLLLEYRSSRVGAEGTPVRIQGIARNVTEQNLQERSLRKRERQLRSLLATADRMQEDLRVVTRELLRVQEEERRRISRELHDELGQLLAAITLNLEVLKKTLQSTDEAKFRKTIRETEELASTMFARMRSFLKDLRPIALDETGLLPAVRLLADEFAARTGLAVEFSGSGESFDALGEEKKVVLYRVIQESLTNVVKHAQASAVAIRLESAPDGCAVEIADDGRGAFPADAPSGGLAGAGLGMLGMRERLDLVRGELSIVSTPGRGTTVRAAVPWDAPLTPHASAREHKEGDGHA
jgi:PAS domain S-box-containing protein